LSYDLTGPSLQKHDTTPFFELFVVVTHSGRPCQVALNLAVDLFYIFHVQHDPPSPRQEVQLLVMCLIPVSYFSSDVILFDYFLCDSDSAHKKSYTLSN
jgi:hypothetical protein